MKTRADRIEQIRTVCRSAEQNNSPTYPIKHWKGDTRLDRRIIRLDHDYLMSRIENSRTEIQQLAYIKKRNLREDHFADPESYAAQKSQEEILLEMIHSKGLLDDLSKRKQEDPCIITFEGYLVNGNRRTAALKTLDTRYIECIVLPEDATPKDIYALEQQLQISQDFREDYHWINELRNIRRGREDKSLKFSERELANNLRMEVSELKKKLRMLELVDSFLIWKWIKGQYDYSQLDDAEEAFRQLEKSLKKYSKDHTKQEKLQNEVFTLIESRPEKGRLYNYVTALIKNFDQIQKRLLENNETASGESETAKSETSQSGDLIDQLIGINKTDNSDEFSNPSNAEDNSSKLIEAIADVSAANQERTSTEAVYDGVSKALRELQGLIVYKDTAKLESTKNKLHQIIHVSTSLLKDIDSLLNESQ
ncbi:MAG: hypothetical protein LUF90_09645 [Rikenellaceae bacterium]|nr:hypothetical protein [Rikenellaceae bacterium]